MGFDAIYEQSLRCPYEHITVINVSLTGMNVCS